MIESLYKNIQQLNASLVVLNAQRFADLESFQTEVARLQKQFDWLKARKPENTRIFVSSEPDAISDGGTPGGDNTQIQYNDNGEFGADDGLTWNASGNLLTVGTIGVPGTIAGPTAATGTNLIVRAGNGTSGDGGDLSLEGGTSDDDTGGNVELLGGISVTATGGTVVLQGGPSFIAQGGNVEVDGGAGSSGGQMIMSGGASQGAGTSGGSATLRGGVPSNGTGGGVAVTARNGVGTNRNGGNITLTIGNQTGSGIKGHLLIVNLENFADDAAAATGNVPVNGVYRNGSVLQIRVS
jgi:hypothetical protein